MPNASSTTILYCRRNRRKIGRLGPKWSTNSPFRALQGAGYPARCSGNCTRAASCRRQSPRKQPLPHDHAGREESWPPRQLAASAASRGAEGSQLAARCSAWHTKWRARVRGGGWSFCREGTCGGSATSKARQRRGRQLERLPFSWACGCALDGARVHVCTASVGGGRHTAIGRAAVA
jgi:hypothetical protein